MPQWINILNLAIADNPAIDEAEVTQRIEHAAELVRTFAVQSGQPALDMLISAAEGSATEGAKQAQEAAKIVTQQTELLFDETARFLSLATSKS